MARPDEDAGKLDRPRPGRRSLPTLLLVSAAVLAVLAAFAGYEITHRHQPTFRSTGAVAFDQPGKLASSTNAGIIDKLSRMRANYIGLARTDAVVDAVGKQVNLPRARVAPRIFTQADPNSLLLIIGAQAPDAPSARRIATALANELVVIAEQQQVKAKIPEADRITASVVIQPRQSTLVQPTTRKALTVGAVAGLLTFLAILGLGSLLRRPR